MTVLVTLRRLGLALPLAACSRGVHVASGTPSSPVGTVVVANMGDNTATILDVASRRALATVPTGAGPHEVAVSHLRETPRARDILDLLANVQAAQHIGKPVPDGPGARTHPQHSLWVELPRALLLG